MLQEIDYHRRHFFGIAAGTLALGFGAAASVDAQSVKATPDEIVGRTEPNASLGSLKQIDAGLLNVGYAEAGPSDGPVVIREQAG